MKVRVLRPFAFSRDGLTLITAAAGDTPDIPEGLVRGLIAERFVAIAPPEAKDGKPAATAAGGESSGGAAAGEGSTEPSPEKPGEGELPPELAGLAWVDLQKRVSDITGKRPKSKAEAVELLKEKAADGATAA